MHHVYATLITVVTLLILNGCTHFSEPDIEDINCSKLAGNYPNYLAFKKCTSVKSYKVYKDRKQLIQATPHNTKVIIDISDQRARLYVDGKVALDTPCTTGSKRKFEPNTKTYRDKRTPLGNFKITEKIKNKRSTIFGKYYRGNRCVYKGDRRKYRGSKKGLRYEGQRFQTG